MLTATNFLSHAELGKIGRWRHITRVALIEIYLNRTWRTMCDDSWGIEEVNVNCWMLKFAEGTLRAQCCGFYNGYGVARQAKSDLVGRCPLCWWWRKHRRMPPCTLRKSRLPPPYWRCGVVCKQQLQVIQPFCFIYMPRQCCAKRSIELAFILLFNSLKIIFTFLLAWYSFLLHRF